MENCENFRGFDYIYILVANPCNARASCEIGLLVKDNLSNLLKITTHICIKITTQIET